MREMLSGKLNHILLLFILSFLLACSDTAVAELDEVEVEEEAIIEPEEVFEFVNIIGSYQMSKVIIHTPLGVEVYYDDEIYYQMVSFLISLSSEPLQGNFLEESLASRLEFLSKYHQLCRY